MYRAAIGAMLMFSLLPAGVMAQERNRGRAGAERVPRGHLPPPGQCRVWYEDRPPGQQPRPTDCRTAERIARGDRYARVVYGDDRSWEGYPYGDDDRGSSYPNDRRRGDRGRRGDRDREDADDRARGRAVPRGAPYPSYPGYPGDGYPQRSPQRDDRRSTDRDYPGWDAGYRDGLVKGREDAQKDRNYEPERHQWYRSASRGYDRRDGLRGAYANVYRDGFEAGYAAAFRGR